MRFSTIVYEREHGSQKLGEQLTANVKMRPSEYFDRNCFLGASNTNRRELARRYEIGVGNICWGNDFPHPEGIEAAGREGVRVLSFLASHPPEQVRILLGNLRPTLGNVNRAPDLRIGYVPQIETVNWNFPITVGEVVLMSPACASFDMFRNYEHRAQVFHEAVVALAADRGVLL